METVIATRTRGTIIKVPDATPGLLVFDGRQAPFTLEGRWKSPVAPAANMTVELELDGSGAIVGILALDAQQLAKERLNQFGDVAQQQSKIAVDMARRGVGSLAARMGTTMFAAAVALWVAWFLLPAASINFILIVRSFTFWELLGLDVNNPGNPMAGGRHGFFSLVGLAAISAPFAAPFVVHPRARYLNALPLVYILLTVLKLVWDIERAFGRAGGLFQEAAQSVMSEMLKATSLGAGTYIMIIAALLLAIRGVRRP